MGFETLPDMKRQLWQALILQVDLVPLSVNESPRLLPVRALINQSHNLQKVTGLRPQGALLALLEKPDLR